MRAVNRAPLVGLLVLVLLPAGCGGEPAIDGGPPAPVAPPALSEAEAAELPPERARAFEDDWATRADATPGGVAAARQAASLARVRAWRDPEGDALERARTLLREASRRRTIEGACDAALDLARLEARDAARPEAAYLVAYRTARRFRDPRDQACATEARRMLGALEGFRADRGLLAAIDADPDADDPSVGLAGDPVSGARPADEAMAEWAEARVAEGERATITSIVTYGGDAEARGVRVVIALDRVVTFERIDLDADGDLPPRVALDLAGATAGPDLPATIEVTGAGLERIRHAPREGGTRVALDLQRGAEARVFILPEPFRIVIDVLEGGARAASGPREVDLVLLDPGHGGADYGARAFGMHEADITLDLAVRTRDVLRRRLPDVRVVLTRETDTFITLEQRAASRTACRSLVVSSTNVVTPP